ncbi:MAG: HAD hydrolase-like protein [Oscillospiraceae bacterium]
MAFTTILFDLDGTLTDPKAGITTAVSVALRHFGIEAEPDSLTKFIGPPLDEGFREFYGFDEAQAKEAIREFRAYYSRQGWRENVPYEGAAALLAELQAAGRHLLVATSKPEVFAVKILEHFGMAQYFDGICGAPLEDPNGAKKAAVIRDALRRFGAVGDAVMVGDRRHDVQGAHEAGLPAIGVLYGYGDRDELTAAGAEQIAEDIPALRILLLGND